MLASNQWLNSPVNTTKFPAERTVWFDCIEKSKLEEHYALYKVRYVGVMYKIVASGVFNIKMKFKGGVWELTHSLHYWNINLNNDSQCYNFVMTPQMLMSGKQFFYALFQSIWKPVIFSPLFYKDKNDFLPVRLVNLVVYREFSNTFCSLYWPETLKIFYSFISIA